MAAASCINYLKPCSADDRYPVVKMVSVTLLVGGIISALAGHSVLFGVNAMSGAPGLCLGYGAIVIALALLPVGCLRQKKFDTASRASSVPDMEDFDESDFIRSTPSPIRVNPVLAGLDTLTGTGYVAGVNRANAGIAAERANLRRAQWNAAQRIGEARSNAAARLAAAEQEASRVILKGNVNMLESALQEMHAIMKQENKPESEKLKTKASRLSLLCTAFSMIWKINDKEPPKLESVEDCIQLVCQELCEKNAGNDEVRTLAERVGRAMALHFTSLDQEGDIKKLGMTNPEMEELILNAWRAALADS